MTIVAPAIRPHRARDVADDRAAVAILQHAFRAAPLPLDLPGAPALRAERAQVIEQFDDYVLPRLDRLDAPPLVVVGGPTGAGKSTLVNALVGARVTTPGLLRPTTRSPVLVHHPADRDWFADGDLLATLERRDVPSYDEPSLQLAESAAVPGGLAILDAPDFDSIDDRNRLLSTRLLGAADLWLFVTTAARYSDQVPWQQLEAAVARDLPVAIVVNRVPPEDLATVSGHLGRMLDERGIARDRLFFVEQGTVGADEMLPPSYVADIAAWLTRMGSGSEGASTVARAVRGATRRATDVARRVATAAGTQVAAVNDLLDLADGAYGRSAAALTGALADGSLVRGDLMTRWHAFVGSDDLPAFAETMSLVRQRLADPGPDGRRRIELLSLALDLALETLVVDHAERAAADASATLRASEHGRALLDWSDEDLSRPGRGLAARARRAIAGWHQDLDAHVAAEVDGDATSRRALAIALVLYATASAESGHPLVAAARDGVTTTLLGLLAEERDRYLRPVLGWELTPDAPARLRTAADEVAGMLARTGEDVFG